MNGFTEITNEYKQKHYPKGYFARIAKHSRGITLILCGLVLAAMGLLVGILPVYAIIDIIRGTNEFNMDVSVIIFFIIVTAVLLVPGILIIKLGITRQMMGREQWIKKCAETSDYPENTIQEFDSQFMRTDALLFQLDATGITNVLTTDYIFCGNLLAPCLIKISDIVGAYLVLLPDTININGKIKRVMRMNTAVFSNHHTSMLLLAKQDRAEYLISLLCAKNPNIDTMGGKVLSENEYEDLRRTLLKLPTSNLGIRP